MTKYKAVIFDLDDTLVDRNEAIDNLFYIILGKYYTNISSDKSKVMLERFRIYDKESYGDPDKVKVIQPFFKEFPSEINMHEDSMIDFWNKNLPKCFKANQKTMKVLEKISNHMKTAIITNGVTERQKAKIAHSNLNRYFETIIISEEIGLKKPDREIYEITLEKLSVSPEEALFVGDNLVLDVDGPQKSGMTGVWFNPSMERNKTDIKPDYEISSLETLQELLSEKNKLTI